MGDTLIALANVCLDLSKSDGERWFTGWGSVQVLDVQKDLMERSEIEPIIPLLRTRYNRFFDQHTDLMLGEFSEFEFREKEVSILGPKGEVLRKERVPGLWFKGHFYDDYPLQKEKWEAFKSGFYQGFSLRGGAAEVELKCSDNTCSTMHRIPRGVQITSFSIVRSPANKEARIESFNDLAKSDVETSTPCGCGERNMAGTEADKSGGTEFISKADFGAFKVTLDEALAKFSAEIANIRKADKDEKDMKDAKDKKDAEAKSEKDYAKSADVAALVTSVEALRKAVEAIPRPAAATAVGVELKKGQSAEAPGNGPSGDTPQKPAHLATMEARWKGVK